MYLIATGKIAEYINLTPTARVDLLTWLKEYPYVHGSNVFSHQKHAPSINVGTGVAGIDKGDYSVRYRINHPAKAVYITWVGSKEDINLEIKELEQRYPGSILVKKTVRTLNVPSWEEVSQAPQVQPEYNPVFTIPDVQQASKDNGIGKQRFETYAEYLVGLERAEAIFEAVPGVSEFSELMTLLPLLQHYEYYNLKFAQLQPHEIVNHKMKVLDMIPSYFTSVIDMEELQQFLFGNLVLPPDVLQRLYNFLYIRLPVEDQRFHH